VVSIRDGDACKFPAVPYSPAHLES
jgi:hypothetical protein